MPTHLASGYHSMQRFLAEPDFSSNVVRFDLPRLGDVSRLRRAHLQCHIGTDTVSLARLGASMTGLDFSGKAVEAAQKLASGTGADATRVRRSLSRLRSRRSTRRRWPVFPPASRTARYCASFWSHSAILLAVSSAALAAGASGRAAMLSAPGASTAKYSAAGWSAPASRPTSRCPTAGSSSTSAGPTDDKWAVTLETPRDPDRLSSLLNIRVREIVAVYAEWTATGRPISGSPPAYSGAAACAGMLVGAYLSAATTTRHVADAVEWGADLITGRPTLLYWQLTVNKG